MGNDGQVISSDDLINQMNSLESLYVIVKNFSSFSENGQLLINGNLYSIENLISSTINVAGNYGITINNPDSIKNFEDLKNAILEYKNKFDNIGNEINNLNNQKNKLLDYKNKLNDNLNQLQIEKNNLNNKKIKLMDDKNKLLSNIDSFNNVITLQQYLSSNKSNLKSYMNANNSNIPNILDDICKELKDKIPEDNYNSVFKVVEMCKKNKNGNLENIIEILNRVTKNLVDDVTTIYIVGNLIEKLKEQSQNNNYKISSIRLFIKETNYSLLPAFEFL